MTSIPMPDGSRPGSAFGTHVADQVDAATREARTIMDALASLVGGDVDQDSPHSDWVLECIVTATRKCAHLQSPQPCFVPAWEPGVMLCFPCARTRGPVDPDIQRTCDRCGTVGSDLTRPLYIQVGPMFFQAGLCEPCIDIEGRS